jgi:sporulation protein YtfJ
MNDHPIQDFMSTAMNSIKDMVDVNTIVGDPITTTDGTTIIPVSKVSFGFVTGGSDIPTSNINAQERKPFGGAVTSGVSVTPIAFLIVCNGVVKIISVSNSITTIDKMIELIPDVIDKVKNMMNEKKNTANDENGESAYNF